VENGINNAPLSLLDAKIHQSISCKGLFFPHFLRCIRMPYYYVQPVENVMCGKQVTHCDVFFFNIFSLK
jgi:hypothetical protein